MDSAEGAAKRLGVPRVLLEVDEVKAVRRALGGSLNDVVLTIVTGAVRRFLDVTLPQLKEVLIVVIVFRTIWTFNKFEEIYLLTKGGPGTSTFNLAVYSFEQSIANLRLGVGAATGVVMMVMLSLGSILYLRVSGFGEDEKSS